MLRLLPDAEALVTTYLREHLEVDAESVSTELPPTPVYPLLLVGLIGGAPKLPYHLDAPLLQVDAWADTKGEARTLAATAHAALHEMPLDNDLDAVVTNVETRMGLRWSPDPVSEKPRYVFRVQVDSHPRPQGS